MSIMKGISILVTKEQMHKYDRVLNGYEEAVSNFDKKTRCYIWDGSI